MVGVVLFLFLSYQCGGGATVVTVGDVHGGNLGGEQFNEAGDGSLVVDDPETVAEAVFLGDEVVFGSFVANDVVHDSVDFIHSGISEEHRLHIGIGDAHVFHTVFLFVFTGELMFLDDFVDIVLAVSAGHDTILPVGIGVCRVHALGIDIQFVFLIAFQPAVIFESVEVFHHLKIHFGRVLIGANGQVDLSLGDVQQAVWIAFGFLAGFFGVQHVVGT